MGDPLTPEESERARRYYADFIYSNSTRDRGLSPTKKDVDACIAQLEKQMKGFRL